MNYLSVYAFVQIVGESLPLSSSGNVKVWTTVCDALGLLSAPSVPFPRDVDFLLHIPTLFILLIFFFKRWIQYLPWYACSWSFTTHVALWTLLVDIITSFFYVVIAISDIPLPPLWVNFLVTAVLLYSTRTCTVTSPQDSVFTLRKGLAFGTVQGIACIPGISRFASTFALARWYGYKPSDALWYSFMIQIPLLIAAIPFALYTNQGTIIYQIVPPSLIALACLSAYGLLTLVAQKADRCTFWHFSWYALGLAALTFYLGL